MKKKWTEIYDQKQKKVDKIIQNKKKWKKWTKLFKNKKILYLIDECKT